ncbi:MAG TPA: hypothetical protein VK034_12855 [Enhygromyxa sp.]|nr:hypothetical protein [Enhygromyxa sp.]
MRGPSRLLALVGLTSLIVTPLPVAAAPAADTDTDSDSGDAEPPLDTDSDTDENEPPLDTDGDTDEDEPPLDTDADTDTEDPLLPELVDQVDTDASDRIDDGYDPLRDSPEAKTARRWLGAGITATVAGGVLVGGAIALGLTDPCEPAAGNSCFSDSRNRAAVTMGVPGGVLLLGGVAMTVIGALQKRRLVHDYAGSVTAGRDHIGVVIVGRF